MKILIIDDDLNYIKMIIKNLKHEFYYINSCFTSSHINTEIEHINPDLILLDYFLINTNGEIIYKEIRNLNIPVIMLTNNEESTLEIRMLQDGIIDYIPKDKSIEYLKIKISRVDQNSNFLQVEGYTLNSEKLLLNNLKLTKNEYLLMSILFKHYPQKLQVEELKMALWNEAYFVETNTLHVNITRLRKKLKTNKINLTIKFEEGYYVEKVH